MLDHLLNLFLLADIYFDSDSFDGTFAFLLDKRDSLLSCLEVDICCDYVSSFIGEYERSFESDTATRTRGNR